MMILYYIGHLTPLLKRGAESIKEKEKKKKKGRKLICHQQ